MRPEPLDQGELLLSRFLDGELDASEHALFQAWLREDPAHLDLFAIRAIDHHRVAEMLRVDAMAGLVDLEEESAEVDDADIMSEVVTSALAERRKHELEDEANRQLAAQQAEDARSRRYELRRNAEPEPVKRVVVIPKVVVWLGLAAVLLLGAVLIGVNLPARTTHPTPPITEQQNPEGTFGIPATPDSVATLTLLENAVWSGADQPLSLHSRVTPGPLRLESGIAHFVMDSGAVVMVKGPATIDLSTAWVAELSEGSAVARVPEQAQGFRILGNGFEVTDLGTEFAVHITPDGMRCRVVLGEVELAVTEPDAATQAPRRLRENRLVEVDTAAGTVRELDPAESEDISWALAYTACLHTNLVVNGDFEEGWPGLAHDSGNIQDIDIPGWDDDEATVLDYRQSGALGEGAFPNPETDPMPENRGKAYYVGSQPGTMTQSIDLAALAELTDVGKASFLFRADLGGLGSQNDYARVVVTFLDGRGRSLGQAELDIVDARARRDRSGFIERSREGVLPVGTRSARISITAVHGHGGLTDAYADNIALTVNAVTSHTTDISPASSRDRLNR